MAEDAPPEERTIYVANFDEKVTEDILEELFLQAGPLKKVMVRAVKDSNAKYALVEFEDEASVIFAITLMNGVRLYDREIQVKPRNNTKQEERYRRERGEIEDMLRGMRGTDNSGGNYRRDDSYRGGGRPDREHRDRREYRDSRESRRDWDRDRRDGRGNGNINNDRSRSSGDNRYDDVTRMNHHQNPNPRHRGGGGGNQTVTMLPPPPIPPPLMGGGGQNWRGSAPSLMFQPPPPPSGHFAAPMLPHEHFVQMMQQQHRRQNQNPHQNSYQNPLNSQNQRQYDQRRGADRNSANHHYQQSRRGGGGGGGRY